ncbi:DEKNAAC104943 [Brettanomyces naardenensis]|uniref:DNA 3'-5' helicase n=1 Tax=Brettanomyces naardenensis TaxID=13370 RepID=A0A448YSA7_BRENA|nr:DEKNAAC104943 [Brettanomyces naardenensis]
MPVYKEVFSTLNENQYKALVTPTANVLQILAGPGTGKTRVITARVAYLLCEEKLPPEDVIVTTFTKKAANEMKKRLADLLRGCTPKIDLNKLFIGTFHSICVRILRSFGKHINLDSRFKIADDTDSKQLIKRVLQDKFSANDKVKDSDVNEYKYFISACKSKALLPGEVPQDLSDKAFEDHIYAYSRYQKSLEDNNLIDFDDCLLLAYKLLKKYPQALKNVKHVLVDEFQDTNLVQLELMYLFGLNCNGKVTVVGDPDQSIYGFRQAEANNFYRMEEHYVRGGHQVTKVQLTENYRSTDSILRFAETVMSTKQKSKREPKKLNSNTTQNTPVYFDAYPTNKQEARRIAEDIEGLTKSYKYSDVAVIIRSAFLSRMIEQEFIHANIPYIIVHGRSFWELKEVKLMVDFLRAIASNVDWLGYSRSLEFVVAGMGAKSLENIETEFNKQRNQGHEGNVYRILKRFIKREMVGFNAKLREGLQSYVKTIHKARHILKDDEGSMSELLGKMFDRVVKDSNLVELVAAKKSKGKSEEDAKNEIRENLGELKNQLVTFAPNEEILEGENNTASPFLTQFLDSIYLYEQNHYKQSQENDDSSGKVTITTIHGAKGLEWPIVFVPGLCDGILPSKYVLQETNKMKRDAAMDEECRCLYVAITRAKDILYLSYFAETEGFYYGSGERKPLSRLIRGSPLQLVQQREHKELSGEGFASANAVAKNFDKYKSRNAQQVVKAYTEFSHIPVAVPIVFTTAKKMHSKIMSGLPQNRLNPATGAPIDGPLRKKAKKRLGMGRPLRPFPMNK